MYQQHRCMIEAQNQQVSTRPLVSEHVSLPIHNLKLLHTVTLNSESLSLKFKTLCWFSIYLTLYKWVSAGLSILSTIHSLRFTNIWFWWTYPT